MIFSWVITTFSSFKTWLHQDIICVFQRFSIVEKYQSTVEILFWIYLKMFMNWSKVKTKFFLWLKLEKEEILRLLPPKWHDDGSRDGLEKKNDWARNFDFTFYSSLFFSLFLDDIFRLMRYYNFVKEFQQQQQSKLLPQHFIKIAPYAQS